MSQQVTKSGNSSSFSRTMQLRHDELAALQQCRRRSAQRQLREMQHFTFRPAPFINEDKGFRLGGLTLED